MPNDFLKNYKLKIIKTLGLFTRKIKYRSVTEIDNLHFLQLIDTFSIKLCKIKRLLIIFFQSLTYCSNTSKAYGKAIFIHK